MIKIESFGTGYQMTFSAGGGSGLKPYKVFAACIEEVHEAINHFECAGPRAAQHRESQIDHCPLCRLRQQEATRQEPRERLPMLRLVGVEKKGP